MADLKGVPVSSLPSASSLESDDQVIAYRSSDNQAYRANVSTMAEAANGNISDAFSSSQTYAVGDYCIYNDTLYKCTTEHSGSWSADDFEAVTVSDELTELNSNMFYTEVYEVGSGNITSQSNVDITYTPQPKDGYAIFCVSGFYSESSYFAVNTCYISSANNLRFVAKNIGSDTRSTTVRAVLVYKKI